MLCTCRVSFFSITEEKYEGLHVVKDNYSSFKNLVGV